MSQWPLLHGHLVPGGWGAPGTLRRDLPGCPTDQRKSAKASCPEWPTAWLSGCQVRGRYVGFVLVAGQPGWIPPQLVQTTVAGWGPFWPFWPEPTSWLVNWGNHPSFQCPGPNPSSSSLVVSFYRVIILQYCYSIAYRVVQTTPAKWR